MAGKAQYSDNDKARVYVCLRANGGNIKRTVRDTGVPASTIRHWRTEWDSDEASPPDVSLVALEATTFVEEAERVRDKALSELERKIPTATPSALVAMVGMLSDKIALVRGLATTRVEHKHTLPAPDEIGELVQGFVLGAIEVANQRRKQLDDADVIEGEIIGIDPPDNP